MTEPQLLEMVKASLGMVGDFNDKPLMQNIKAVKNYLRNGGVSDDVLQSDAATSTIVIGVTDLFNLQSGEIKFSPAFFMLTTQLEAVSKDVSAQ